MNQFTKIALIGSRPLIKKGFEQIISSLPNFKVVADISTVAALKQLTSEIQPDIYVFDHHFESFFDEKNHEETNAFLKDKLVLVLSASDAKESIYHIHKLHITSLITLSAEVEEIKTALENTAQGINFFSGKIVEVLIEFSMKRTPVHVPHESLTAREKDVFNLVAQGKSTQEIADELFLSVHTVYTHRKSILKKLACKSASEVVNYAYSHGLIESE